MCLDKNVMLVHFFWRILNLNQNRQIITAVKSPTASEDPSLYLEKWKARRSHWYCSAPNDLTIKKPDDDCIVLSLFT